MHRLSPEETALIAQGGDVLVSALLDDPAWVWTFPDPELRARGVGFLEPRILGVHVPLANCWATIDPGGRRVLACSAWCPPRRRPGMLAFIRHGLAQVPLIVGLAAFLRMMQAQAVMRAVQREYSPEPASWYLHTLGVAPEAQGRGVGSQSLCQILQDVVDPSGLPATLFTSKPVNLRFYERAGFEVLHEERVGDEKGFTFWYMARPVAATVS